MTAFVAVIKFIHLITLVVWVGAIVFLSFFAAPSIFKVLPRETAGEVMGDIFPKYWMVGYVSSAVMFLTLVFISYEQGEVLFVRLVIVLAMGALSLYSGLVVGKEAAAIKTDMRAAQDQTEREALRAVFRKVHMKSSVLNMTVLALGLALIFFTAQKL